MSKNVFPMSPEDYIEATRHLSLEERGAYADSIMLQMILDGPLPNDPGWLGHMMHISKRKVESVLSSLFNKRKLHVTEAGIINERCVREIAARRLRREQRAMAATQRARPVDAVDVDYEQVVHDNSRSVQPRLSAEPTSNRPRTNSENSKKPNKNNDASEHPFDSCASARADNNITNTILVDTDSVKEESPLCPPQTADAVRGGGPAEENASRERKSESGKGAVEKKKRTPRDDKPMIGERETTQALELFNKAAVHWRFNRCTILEGKRRHRFRARLAEIGGLEPFKVALRQIGSDDFLMGRAKGHEDFVLDLDRLLQTDGKMGDVMARLIDAAAAAKGGAAAPPRDVNGKSWGWWRGQEEQLRALSQDAWRRAIDANDYSKGWPWWKLGAPPGHAECVVPEFLITEKKLERWGV